MHDSARFSSQGLVNILIFQIHQHGNTCVVTSDFVFYFHALMQILCKITN